MAEPAPRATPDVRPTMLRGATPWALPLVLVAVTGWTMAVLALLWTAQADASDRTGGFVLAGLTAGLGTLGWALRRGCRVRVRDGRLDDQVAFRTVHEVAQAHIRSAFVTSGPWRWFVLELDDGRTVTLVGTGPLQFPAHLFDPEGRADRAQIDLLMGPDRQGDS